MAMAKAKHLLLMVVVTIYLLSCGIVKEYILEDIPGGIIWLTF